MVTVIWDMRVTPEAADEGLAIIRKIWMDMRTMFAGYAGHRLFEDIDHCGHYVVVSDWVSREEADRVRDLYADAEPVRQLAPLLAEARMRIVLSELP
ncbi:antibiotic biosynthesis monooxygenase [Acidiphilium sp. AL]|uniref:Antibiotic biosynthesis monooxygenase n=1 Tax=Acidiphilium iwatense TaxID=768198 RepID=A0ABS9DVU6_9PROT|nr:MULTISPECIES: antibiotic biosynthesis monooxygenase [Acidiphilium]MCF3946860.1 antibiotic biosynthesis monooxygenase [Acidiphilium iwatense]MCU4161045.1 antibiotic biosynthesis monooxygenase [Acidiphilium sp. AL]